MTTHYATDIESIRQAAERLAGHIHQTPLVSCQTIDTRAGRELLLKCENQQKVGAFKFRGATNAVALLSDELHTLRESKAARTGKPIKFDLNRQQAETEIAGQIGWLWNES